MGLASASFLHEIERHQKARCADAFDLFSGTSTGGIIALALAKGMSADEIVQLYRELGAKVFRNNWPFQRALRLVRRCFTSMYGNHRLRGALEEAFGKTTLADVRQRGKSVVIPAFCVTTGRPRIFKTNHHEQLTRDDEYLLSDIALATSAAPTFLPVVSIVSPTSGAREKFADGGLFANSPALIAYVEALRYLNAARDQVEILSVSTPRSINAESSNALTRWERFTLHRGVLQWIAGLPDTFIQGGMTISHHTLEFLMREANAKDNYVRIDLPMQKGLGLDIADDRATHTLINIGSSHAAQIPTREKVGRFFRPQVDGGLNGERSKAV